MGYIRAEFKLTNTTDVHDFNTKRIKKKDIRSGTYRFLLDSGASLLCINEEIQAQLGLVEIGEETASLADGSIHKFKIVGPVTVEFENRRTTAEAVVLPNDAEPLFGAIIMQLLDIVLDMKEEKVILPPERPYKRVIRV